jgi:hypothetical protein
MSAKMQVTSVAAKTTTGTQDITISGFGTPVAAIFVMSRGVSNGTAAVHSNLSIGFTDGTNERVMTSNDEDAQATSDSARLLDATTEVITMTAEGDSATTIATASFSSWITDGVQINWGTVTGDGERLMVILFGGTDMSAKVGSTTMTATPEDETGVGFQPDVVLTLWADASSGPDDHQISFGCAWDNGASIINRSWAQYQANADAKGNPELFFSETYAATDETSGQRYSLGSFDSNGFTITGGDDPGVPVYWLALKNAGAEAWYLDTYTSPGVFGDDSVTAPGFKPQCVLFGISHAKAVDSVEIDADSASVGVGAMHGLNEEESVVVTSEDNVNDTNTQSEWSTTAIRQNNEDGSNNGAGSFKSFDTNGFTLTWLAPSGTDARKHWYLALQEEIADAGGRTTFNPDSQNLGTKLGTELRSQRR